MFTKVLKAQLWVYLRPLQQTSTVYLQILRLKPVTDQGSRHIRIRSLKIELNSRSGYWQSIDFKHVLQNWFKQPHTNWGIDINAFDESGNDLAVTSLRPGEEGLVRTLRPVVVSINASLMFFNVVQGHFTFVISKLCSSWNKSVTLGKTGMPIVGPQKGKSTQSFGEKSVLRVRKKKRSETP